MSKTKKHIFVYINIRVEYLCEVVYARKQSVQLFN